MARVSISGCPPAADAFAAEVDILGMVVVSEWWGEEADDMHAGKAPITCHFAHEIGFALAFRQAHREFGDCYRGS
jgi:hypothetical protein